MEKIQEISKYVSNMSIRKTLFGGYDKNDVNAKMNELVDMFKKCLEEEKAFQQEQVETYEKRIQTSQLMLNEMNKKLASLLEEQKNSEEEKEKMKGAYKEYCTNILKQYSESLRTLSTEFSMILENISNLQQNMINLEIFDEIEVNIDETPALPEKSEDEE